MANESTALKETKDHERDSESKQTDSAEKFRSELFADPKSSMLDRAKRETIQSANLDSLPRLTLDSQSKVGDKKQSGAVDVKDDPEKIKVDIKDKKEEVDYTKMLGDKRLMMIGDIAHNSPEGKKEAFKVIENLAGKVTHLGLEFVSKEMQPELKQYFDKYQQLKKDGKDPMSDAELNRIRSSIKDQFRDDPMSGFQMDIIDKAVQNGIQPVGLEPVAPLLLKNIMPTFKELNNKDSEVLRNYLSTDKSSPDYQRSRQQLIDSISTNTNLTDSEKKDLVSGLDQMRDTGFKFNKIDLSSDESFSRTYGNEGMDWRNQSMANQIETTLKDPDSKMVTMTGSAHIGYAGWVNPETHQNMETSTQMLSEQTKANTVVVSVSGGDNPVTKADDKGADVYMNMEEQVLDRAATDAGLDQDRFQIELKHAPNRHSDYNVHIPRLK